MPKIPALLAASLLAASAATAQTGSVEVRDAWARATQGRAEIAPVYLSLESPEGDRLTSLSRPVASIAQLQATVLEGGVRKLARLAALDLPAGQPVRLEPGATHIMLIGLTDKLLPGQAFPLTLSFEKAGKREVTV